MRILMIRLHHPSAYHPRSASARALHRAPQVLGNTPVSAAGGHHQHHKALVQAPRARHVVHSSTHPGAVAQARRRCSCTCTAARPARGPCRAAHHVTARRRQARRGVIGRSPQRCSVPPSTSPAPSPANHHRARGPHLPAALAHPPPAPCPRSACGRWCGADAPNPIPGLAAPAR